MKIPQTKSGVASYKELNLQASAAKGLIKLKTDRLPKYSGLIHPIFHPSYIYDMRQVGQGMKRSMGFDDLKGMEKCAKKSKL